MLNNSRYISITVRLLLCCFHIVAFYIKNKRKVTAGVIRDFSTFNILVTTKQTIRGYNIVLFTYL